MKTAKLFFLLLSIIFCSSLSFAQVVSAGSGDWSGDTTWVGGVVPAPNADVVIGEGHKVIFNADAVCSNLTIEGTLEFEKVTPRTLTVNGNLTGDSLKTASISTTEGPLIHTINVSGNLQLTSLFDLRYGSNPNVGAADIVITGSGNSVLSGPSNMDINGVTVNKSDNGKIILASNFYQNNNSSNFPIGILNLNNGIIETGEFEWHVKATGSSSGVQGASALSYFNGTAVIYFGSGTGEKLFPLGDGVNYRPIKVYTINGTSNSGLRGRIVHEDANTGTSLFEGGIDKVAIMRHYFFQNASNNKFSFRYFEPSYGEDDGVSAGNTDLRVAVSYDEKSTWTGKGPETSHTTDLSLPPTFIKTDSLSSADTLKSQDKLYVALARKAGTETNVIPVELTNFSAVNAGNNVLLNWTTITEKNNSGFEIEKSSDNKMFYQVGFVKGSGTSSETRNYSFTDPILNSTGKVYYRLKQIDFDGTAQYSKVVELDIEQPVEYSLMQNYPNPFNPSTTIEYNIPESGFVSLKIYDMLGSHVKTIVNEVQDKGSYNYELDLSELSSGSYIYELKVNSFTQRNKMLLMK